MNDLIDGYDTNGLLVFLAAALLPSAIAIARMIGFPSAPFMQRWFAHHDLEPTPEAVAMASSSLRATKRIRTVGFVLSYSGLQLGWMLYTQDARRSGEMPFFPLLVAGWTISVIVAAVWSVPRSQGMASLAERRVDDYRPAFWRFDREFLVAALAVLTLASVVFPASQGGMTIDGGVALRWVLLTLLAMAVVWLAQRVIVERRQSQPTLALVRVDDALRSVAVSALAGIGYGVPLLCLSSLFWWLTVARDRPGLITLIVVIITTTSYALGLAMVIGFGRLSNESVIYRHRVRLGRPADDRTQPSVGTAP